MADNNNLSAQHCNGKKILFLITQTAYGGAQKYVLQLARYFSAQNTVQIAVGETKHQDAQFFSEARAMGIEPILIPSLIRDISLIKSMEAVMDIRSLLSKEKPDIFHINSSMAGALGSCAAWIYRFDPLNPTIRVVYTVHGFVFNEPLPAWKRTMYIMIEKMTSQWKGALICVSQFDKDQSLMHHVAPDKRMVVVHNGIPIPYQFVDRTTARAKLGLPTTSRMVIGTIAGCYKTKGLHYLIQAARILQDQGIVASYCLIGDGPEHQALEKEIHAAGLQDTFIMCGRIANPALYLLAFDIFVLPSVKEGLSYTILEAGHAGLPVIATRVGGTPEIIIHQKTGLLVSSGDSKELATALANLVKSPTMRDSVGRNLKMRIDQLFTEERMLKETEEVYLRFFKKNTIPTARPSER